MPHPSEALINLRLQTKSQPAVDVFRQGLQNLVGVATHIEATFMRACASSGLHVSEEDTDGCLAPAAAVEEAPGAAAMEEEEEQEVKKMKKKSKDKSRQL